MEADELQLPHSLSINAWTGEEAARSKTSSDAEDWILSSGPPRIRTFLAPPKAADPANWRDPRVGWGLVLPNDPSLSPADAAAAKDAPEPIRALIAGRGENGSPAPVFRYIPGANRVGFLHRNGSDIPVSMAPAGTGPGAIPRYLLIYGTPEQIPWQLQYNLNAVCASGRLTLKNKALENYVGALMSDWTGSSANKNSALVWAVDHGSADITNLMRRSIAERVASKIAGDTDLQGKSRYVDGSQTPATAATLVSELAARKPALVVTTSHGQTGPLDNPDLMTQNLGLLVDSDHALLKPEALLAQWEPGGAIWYAHACCSAGSDAKTLFEGLVDKDSPVDQVLKGVAKIGARTAPLPEALLGANQPLRAFVGHVEPTFDWTLQQRFTGQFQTAAIEEALYDKLYQPQPVGLAFRDFYNRLAGLYAEYDTHLRAFNGGAKREAQMLYNLLLARDVQTMVMLGDPTAILPPLH
jgi:hypothetical protein